MANKIYIVTGAAGHLGRFVVRELLARGRQVRAFLLPGESCPDFIDTNRHLLTEYFGDICVPETMEPLFISAEPAEFVVIHCAGIIAITKKAARRVYDVNVGGTANIIDLCKKHKITRLLYVSSVHAIPPLPRWHVMGEVSFFTPDAVPGYYDKTKAIATQLVLDASAEGLDAVVVHPSGIIGPYGLSTGNMTRVMRLYLRGRLRAAIRGGFDFVDVRDVAEGVISAADKGKSGECYILSNRFIPLEEMFDLLSEVSGRRRLRVYLPLWVAKAASPFAEVYYRLARKTPLFTRYSLHTLSQNSLYSRDKAARELGYRTRPLRDTLADIALWLKPKKAKRAR